MATVLLREQGRWLYFEEPLTALRADHLHEVEPLLRETERLVRSRNCYAVGVVSYEAASAFDPALDTDKAGKFPLLWFGLFRRVRTLSVPLARLDNAPQGWRLSVSKTEYQAAFTRIKQHLAAGDSYQVNYTARLHALWQRTGQALWPWFQRFARDARYAAWLDLPEFTVCSASPELFFTLRGNEVFTRPMKGTRPRDTDPQTDAMLRNALYHAPKDRAENLMITDMLRNDLGRVAVPGSVQVPCLFTVEAHPTVWQMTSSVHAKSRAPFSTIFAALFPCASVTGAPKAATMRLIHALESTPRQLYTGSIGFIAPNGDARFSVAIRTAWLDKHTNRLEYGCGGGIVWDSEVHEEYQEMLLKTQILAT